MEMKAEGLAPRAMRMRIDALYQQFVADATPTPYPPAQ
jgi:hypothetical protein